MTSLERKPTKKTVVEKRKALQDLEKVISKKYVAENCVVPRSTVSIWMRNKKKLLASLEKKGMKVV